MNVPGSTVSSTLADHRRVWRAKPALRAIYADAYRRIAAAAVPGRSLEIGGGIGNLKDHLPDTVSVDIQFCPWLDAVADAHHLPFGDRRFENVVLFDVLHHLQWPGRFLAEAARVLKPGGRLLMVEPAITPLSYPFFRWLHHEPVDMAADPIDPWPADMVKTDPYESNQAIPTLLLGRHHQRLAAAAPQFRVSEIAYFGFIAYPLSGGFRPWSAIPESWVQPLLAIERRFEPLLGRLCGFRLFAALELTGR